MILACWPGFFMFMFVTERLKGCLFILFVILLGALLLWLALSQGWIAVPRGWVSP